MRFLLREINGATSSSTYTTRIVGYDENSWARGFEDAGLSDNSLDNNFTLQDFAELNNIKRNRFIEKFLGQSDNDMQKLLTLVMGDTAHYGTDNRSLKEFVDTLLSDSNSRSKLVALFNGASIENDNLDSDKTRQLMQLIIRNASPDKLKSFVIKVLDSNDANKANFLKNLLKYDCDNKAHGVVEELITIGSRAQKNKLEEILNETTEMLDAKLLVEFGLTKYNKVIDGSGTISRADLARLTGKEKGELACALIKQLPDPRAMAMLKTLIKEGLFKGLDTGSWDNVGAELLRKVNNLSKNGAAESIGKDIITPIMDAVAAGDYDRADLTMLYDNLCNNRVVLGVFKPTELAMRYILPSLNAERIYTGVGGADWTTLESIIDYDQGKDYNKDLASARSTINGREVNGRSVNRSTSTSRTVPVQEAEANYKAYRESPLWAQQIKIERGTNGQEIIAVTIPNNNNSTEIIELPEGIDAAEFKNMAIHYLSATKDGAAVGAPGMADLQKVADFMKKLAEVFGENWGESSPKERALALESAFTSLGIPSHGSDPAKLNWLDWQLFPPQGVPGHFLSNFLTSDNPADMFRAMNENIRNDPTNELTRNGQSLLNRDNLVCRTGDPGQITKAEELAGKISPGQFSGSPAYSSFIGSHNGNTGAILRATAIYCAGREMPGLPQINLGNDAPPPYTVVFNTSQDNFTMEVEQEFYENLARLIEGTTDSNGSPVKFGEFARECLLTRGKLPSAEAAVSGDNAENSSVLSPEEGQTYPTESAVRTSNEDYNPQYYPLVLNNKFAEFGNVPKIPVDTEAKLTAHGLNAQTGMPCVRKITVGDNGISIGQSSISAGTYTQIAITGYPGMTILTSTGENAKTYLVVAGMGAYEFTPENNPIGITAGWKDYGGEKHGNIKVSLADDGIVTIEENGLKTTVNTTNGETKTEGKKAPAEPEPVPAPVPPEAEAQGVNEKNFDTINLSTYNININTGEASESNKITAIDKLIIDGETFNNVKINYSSDPVEITFTGDRDYSIKLPEDMTAEEFRDFFNNGGTAEIYINGISTTITKDEDGLSLTYDSQDYNITDEDIDKIWNYIQSNINLKELAETITGPAPANTQN
jgi:hypothetical protein